MSTIPMPDPLAWITDESLRNLKTGRTNSKGAAPVNANRSRIAKTPIITTTQAEAYKDACVREIFGWRTIDTAPKHAEVLVWREDSGPFIAKLTDPYEVIPVEEMDRENMEFPDDFEEWYSDAYGWQEGSEKPTHWMPLPPPPHNDNEQGNY